jgi:hypothetical protein
VSANQVEPAIAEISRLGGWDPEGPKDLDETIASLSGISRAAGYTLIRIGIRTEGMGLHDGFSEALHENGESVLHTASELEGHLSGGLMKRGGGSERTSETTSPAIDTLGELGGRDFTDADDVHDTLREISGILTANSAAYTRISDTIKETGAHVAYPDELDQAAGNLAMNAADLHSRVGEGVMRRPQ